MYPGKADDSRSKILTQAGWHTVKANFCLSLIAGPMTPIRSVTCQKLHGRKSSEVGKKTGIFLVTITKI